jgi:hypothetical protein
VRVVLVEMAAAPEGCRSRGGMVPCTHAGDKTILRFTTRRLLSYSTCFSRDFPVCHAPFYNRRFARLETSLETQHD